MLARVRLDYYIAEKEHKLISQKFSVPTQYNVYFTRRSLDPCNPTLANALCADNPIVRRKVFVVLDRGLSNANLGIEQQLVKYFRAHRNALEMVSSPMVVPGGEIVKDAPRWPLHIQRQLHKFHIDRHAIVLILGGGAVLDMAGFAVATTHRGVRTVRMPTTLLSQADGGLGVKTGINSFGVKNFLGTFTAPFGVLNDSDLLLTLAPRHLISGMAEAVKVALIRDVTFWGWLEESSDRLRSFHHSSLENLVHQSAIIHLEHISKSGDPFELGSARPLDFGHWAAHKLEMLSSYKIHHGEAVAIGIAIDCRYSTEVGLLTEMELERILALLHKLGLPIWHTACDLKGSDGRLKILDGLDEFKEHVGGDLTITLLKKIGEGKETRNIDRTIVKRALSWLRKRHSSRCASK